MISYYDLLGMIKEGNEPDLVRLRLNCGAVYYQAYYDDDEFNYYGICDGDDENDDFKHYLVDSLLESQMFERNIEVIKSPKKIEKIELVNNGSLNSYAIYDENGTKCALTKHSKVMADKINEIIDEINKIKEDK